MEHIKQTTDHRSQNMNVPCSVFRVSYRRGFTLIELMVSIAIFVTITSIVVMSQNRFGGNLLVTNLAYDVALGIRQAQVYGVSVKATNVGNFNKSYGIHFENTGYYILFVDTDDSGSYDTSGHDTNGCKPETECLKIWRIERGNLISNFCAGSDCAIDGEVERIDILFSRPNPEPIIVGFKDGASTQYSRASVTVTSPQGVSKVISVLPSGQVSIN